MARGVKKQKFPLEIPPDTSPAARRPREPRVNMASQTDAQEGPATPVPGIPEVLAAVAACKAAVASCQAALTNKIEKAQMDVGLIRQDQDKVCSRLTEAETRVGQVEDALGKNTSETRSLSSRVKLLKHRAEDAENRCRRNNIRIVGLAEGAEGRNPFMELDLCTWTLEEPKASTEPWLRMAAPLTIPGDSTEEEIAFYTSLPLNKSSSDCYILSSDALQYCSWNAGDRRHKTSWTNICSFHNSRRREQRKIISLFSWNNIWDLRSPIVSNAKPIILPVFQGNSLY